MPEGVFPEFMLAFAGSILLTRCYLSWARRGAAMDIPNERSAHREPVPRGGGLAFVLVFLVACLVTGALVGSYLVLVVAAVAIALIALVDDFRPVPARLRFAGYALVIALFLAFSLPVEQARGLAHLPLLLTYPLVFVAVIWHTNLYNFMDGIDGLAAGQGISVLLSAVLLLRLADSTGTSTMMMLVLAAALAGFLWYNRPPARLFMGDIGSIFLGFVLAGFAVLTIAAGELSLVSWLIIMAVFITDASYTLVWRMATGQPFLSAHNLHAYQRLSRHWNSHGRTVLLLMAINLLWLLPLACLNQRFVEAGPAILVIAYLPLLVAMAKSKRLQ